MVLTNMPEADWLYVDDFEARCTYGEWARGVVALDGKSPMGQRNE